MLMCHNDIELNRCKIRPNKDVTGMLFSNEDGANKRPQ